MQKTESLIPFQISQPAQHKVNPTTNIADSTQKAAHDVAFMLEIDLKLGRRKAFYDRVQRAMAYLQQTAEATDTPITMQ